MFLDELLNIGKIGKSPAFFSFQGFKQDTKRKKKESRKDKKEKKRNYPGRQCIIIYHIRKIQSMFVNVIGSFTS